jgi:hypothetical protein
LLVFKILTPHILHHIVEPEFVPYLNAQIVATQSYIVFKSDGVWLDIDYCLGLAFTGIICLRMPRPSQNVLFIYIEKDRWSSSVASSINHNTINDGFLFQLYLLISLIIIQSMVIEYNDIC